MTAFKKEIPAIFGYFSLEGTNFPIPDGDCMIEHNFGKIYTTHNYNNITKAGQELIWNTGNGRPSPSNQEFSTRFSIKHEKLLICTNWFGLYSVFYSIQGKKLFFSTNLRNLLMFLPAHPININEDALLHSYLFGFQHPNLTLLEGISKIPAGSELSFGKNGISINKYFDCADLFFDESYNDFTEMDFNKAIDIALSQGLAKTCISKASGLSISGGVDSGYIAQKLIESGEKPIAFNLSYGDQYNEHGRLDFLQKELNLDVRKIRLEAPEILANFEAVNQTLSLPTGFNNAAMQFVSEAASENGVKVLYDGDGADRLFLGMNRYLQFNRLLKIYGTAQNIHLEKLLTAFINILPVKSIKKVSTHYANWSSGIVPYLERIYGSNNKYSKGFERTIFQKFVDPYWQSFHSKYPGYKIFSDPFVFLTYFSIAKCPEMFFQSPAEIHTMNGVQGIPAYWSHELVKLAVNIPVSLKIKNNTTKYILRKAVAQKLTPDYWQLPKIGMQSSFSFATKTDQGTKWINQSIEEIKKGEPQLNIIQKLLPNDLVEYHRLLPEYFWLKSLK